VAVSAASILSVGMQPCSISSISWFLVELMIFYSFENHVVTDGCNRVQSIAF
jgi:hypothetical protein